MLALRRVTRDRSGHAPVLVSFGLRRDVAVRWGRSACYLPPVSDDDPRESTTAGARFRRAESLVALLGRFSRLWGFALFLLFVVFLFRQIILPFIFALLIAYLLAPTVRRLQPRVGRGGAVGICYVVIFALLAGFFGYVLPALAKEAANLRDAMPELVAKADEEWLPQATAWFEESFGGAVGGEAENPTPQAPPEVIVTPLPDGSFKVSLADVRLAVEPAGEGQLLIRAPRTGEAAAKPTVSELVRRFTTAQGEGMAESLGEMARSLVEGVFHFMTSLVVTFMLAAFLLVDLERVWRFVVALVPLDYRKEFTEIMTGIEIGMAGVIRGQLMICVVNGVLTYIGLLIFGIKYALILGIIACAFSLVPIFGTIISSAPILVIALISGPEGTLAFGKSLAMLGWIAGIHLLEANFLNPKIIGDNAHIHPVVVVFALLAGEEVYGLTGALLAVPTASLIQTFFVFFRRRSDSYLGRFEDVDHPLEEEAIAERSPGASTRSGSPGSARSSAGLSREGKAARTSSGVVQVPLVPGDTGALATLPEGTKPFDYDGSDDSGAAPRRDAEANPVRSNGEAADESGPSGESEKNTP